MTFAIDTYNWWEAYDISFVLTALIVLLIVFRAPIARKLSLPKPETDNTKRNKGDIALRTSIVFFAIFLSCTTIIVSALITDITQNALKPWAPNELTVSASEVTLRTSETQPNKLCFTVDG